MHKAKTIKCNKCPSKVKKNRENFNIRFLLTCMHIYLARATSK